MIGGALAPARAAARWSSKRGADRAGEHADVRRLARPRRQQRREPAGADLDVVVDEGQQRRRRWRRRRCCARRSARAARRGRRSARRGGAATARVAGSRAVVDDEHLGAVPRAACGAIERERHVEVARAVAGRDDDDGGARAIGRQQRLASAPPRDPRSCTTATARPAARSASSRTCVARARAPRRGRRAARARLGARSAARGAAAGLLRGGLRPRRGRAPRCGAPARGSCTPTTCTRARLARAGRGPRGGRARRAAPAQLPARLRGRHVLHAAARTARAATGATRCPGVRLNCRGTGAEAAVYAAALALWQRRIVAQADARRRAERVRASGGCASSARRSTAPRPRRRATSCASSPTRSRRPRAGAHALVASRAGAREGRRRRDRRVPRAPGCRSSSPATGRERAARCAARAPARTCASPGRVAAGAARRAARPRRAWRSCRRARRDVRAGRRRGDGRRRARAWPARSARCPSSSASAGRRARRPERLSPPRSRARRRREAGRGEARASRRVRGGCGPRRRRRRPARRIYDWIGHPCRRGAPPLVSRPGAWSITGARPTARRRLRVSRRLGSSALLVLVAASTHMTTGAGTSPATAPARRSAQRRAGRGPAGRRMPRRLPRSARPPSAAVLIARRPTWSLPAALAAAVHDEAAGLATPASMTRDVELGRSPQRGLRRPRSQRRLQASPSTRAPASTGPASRRMVASSSAGLAGKRPRRRPARRDGRPYDTHPRAGRASAQRPSQSRPAAARGGAEGGQRRRCGRLPGRPRRPEEDASLDAEDRAGAAARRPSPRDAGHTHARSTRQKHRKHRPR